MIDSALLDDCARSLRIAYTLEEHVTPELLAQAGARTIQVHEFSRSVASASDYVTASFDDSNSVRGEAIVGGHTLIMTFGSLHGIAQPEAVAGFEAMFRAALVVG